MSELLVEDEEGWKKWREKWDLHDDTIYLNHGSFGPPPRSVREARRAWSDRLDSQPMDFYLRTWEPALKEAISHLAELVGTKAANMVCVDNATYGMNVVAASMSLRPGDEVLLTDHEYGAVQRIWTRACQRAGACPPRHVSLPLPIESNGQLVDAIFAEVNQHTQLIVVSHITSPTAITLPVEIICRRAREMGVATCIDGPHAVAQLPLEIDRLDCDFYTASCHKWLCAPFGSGFLYVHPRQQALIEPIVLSWGRLANQPLASWTDEFTWLGTRDPSAFLAVPAAINFLRSVGLDSFRCRTHYLARYARQRLVEVTKRHPFTPDSDEWFGAMAHVPLAPGEGVSLQTALWKRFGIEVPIIEFAGGRFVRVSCHLYNSKADIDYLVEALRELV